MKVTYTAPDTAVELLGTETHVLQASGNLVREDYGDWVTNEWEG